MNTAVIYCRQSFGGENESASIEVQQQVCRAYCQKNNITIIAEYCDYNTSSELYPLTEQGKERALYDDGFQQWKKEQRSTNRKEYKEELGRAFECIEHNKIDYIVCYDTDRIYRNARNSNLGNYITLFLLNNRCSIVEAHNNSTLDYSDRMQQLFAEFRSAIEYESLHRKRISSIQSIERRKNSFIAVTTAFGTQTKNRRITFDPKHAEMIKYIYTAVLEGRSYSEILHRINQKYKQLLPYYSFKGIRRKAKQFYGTNIVHILTNPIYCGYMRNTDGDLCKARNIENPPITYSEYIEVQRKMEEKKHGYQKYNLKENKQRHFLPLSGFMRCECGRKLTVAFDNGIVYRCINDGSHTLRIRTNYYFHNQSLYTTLQGLFIINCIKSRKQLIDIQNIDSHEDEIKAQIDQKSTEKEVKFKLAKNIEDIELIRPMIDELNREINNLKNELEEIKIQKERNYSELREKIEQEFFQIQNLMKLQEHDYKRLLEETIKEIIVSQNDVIIHLTDGNTFSIPRITINKRGQKVLPWIEVTNAPMVASDYDDSRFLDKEFFTFINFYCADKPIQEFRNKKADTLLDTPTYSIRLFRE